jgi:DNA/RNA-binding domain of Phe-tRNA-synthetase-like protein
MLAAMSTDLEGHPSQVTMSFSHAPEIWREFPQLVAGVLIVGGVRPDVELHGRLEPWHERARERLSRGPESELAEVSAWRRAYAQMGLKPTQYRSAAEALLRRFRREGTMPHLHPLVDLCNALSLAFALPVAALDLARVDSHLLVRHATGDEAHLGFGGELERPDPGEVIFADAVNHAHARRWTFRQSRHSTVSAATRDVLIVTEGLHPTAGADVPALLDALAQSLPALGSTLRERAILTAAAPRLDFAVTRTP